MPLYPSGQTRIPLRKNIGSGSRSVLGPPDVYPQDKDQKEDELNAVHVKQGLKNFNLTKRIGIILKIMTKNPTIFIDSGLQKKSLMFYFCQTENIVKETNFSIRKAKLTTFFEFVCQNNFFSLLLINFIGFTQSYAALVREEEYSSMVSKNDNMVNTNKVLADLKNIMTKKEGKYINLNL